MLYVLELSVTASYSTAPCFIVQLSGKQEVQTKVILMEKGGLISGAVKKENAVADEGVEYPNCSSEGTQRPPSHSFACCCASSSGENPRKQRHGKLDEIAIRRALVR